MRIFQNCILHGFIDITIDFDGHNSRTALVAVSYTHLDVYKRQPYFNRKCNFPQVITYFL